MNRLHSIDGTWEPSDEALLKKPKNSLIARIYAEDCDLIEEDMLRGWMLMPPRSWDAEELVRAVEDGTRGLALLEEHATARGRRQLWGREDAVNLKKIDDRLLPSLLCVSVRPDGAVFSTPLRFHSGVLHPIVSFVLVAVVGLAVAAYVVYELSSFGSTSKSVGHIVVMFLLFCSLSVANHFSSKKQRAPEYFEEMVQASGAVRAALLEKGWSESGGGDDEESALDIG